MNKSDRFQRKYTLATFAERKCSNMGDKNPHKQPKPKKNAKKTGVPQEPAPQPTLITKEKKISK